MGTCWICYCSRRRRTWRVDFPSCLPRIPKSARYDAVVRDLIPSMSDHIYKKIELVGSSPNGVEDAVNNAIGRAGKTIRNMKWFEVAEVRGNLENNTVAHWQVTVKVGFTLDT